MVQWAVVIAGAAALLSACTATVRPQPAKVEVPGATVTIGGSGGSGPGTFCPHGQAKKGRC